MKKILKILVIILLAAFMVIQFFKPSKNASEEIAGNQIEVKNQVPEDVHEILKVSCYDCHSNTTYYPWYWGVQPTAWFLNNHIQEGKRELNFSNFATYPAWKRYNKIKAIGKEVKSGDMPLFSYTLIHRNAVLNNDKKLAIENWVANSLKDMESHYPADSLKKKK